MLRTPILFLIFNRPDKSELVLEKIRKVKPKQLYVAADGPRKECEGEIKKCLETRDLIKTVDWDCEIKTLFRDNNLGCRLAVSSAINWFFTNVSEGIILEDDCVPSDSFFPYCSELLDRYRDDKRIMMISGDNFIHKKQNYEFSYFFSRYHFIWGWASWRRAWALYDVEMNLWPNVRNQHAFLESFSDRYERSYWLDILDQTHRGEIDTWDFQWAFSMWVNNGLSICPSSNLIKNIGFDESATHTLRPNKVSDLENLALEFPLKHPPFCYRNVLFDRMSFETFFEKPDLLRRFYHKLKKNFTKYLNNH